MTKQRLQTRLVCGVAAVLLAAGWISAGAAGAAITSFALSPTSGPTGTVVTVSGSGCDPGFTVSAASDYVSLTAPSLQVSTRLPVTGYGGWHGSFTVPGGAPAAPAVVAALCVSDGLPSLTTLYTPQTFTVTAPPATTSPTTTTTPGTTNPTTPTTRPHPGSTTPRTDGNPKPGGGGGSGSTVPVFGGFPPDSSGGGTTPGSEHGGSGNSGSGTTRPRPVKVDVNRAAQARAADLSVPGLPAARVAGSDRLGWLAWLLLLALASAAVAGPYWLRRSRRREADASEPGAAA